jgi:hypothetical protein
VIDQREVNFEVVKKQIEEYQRVYGEKSSDVPFTNALYSFFILEKKGENQTKIIFENYMESKGIFSKAIARYVLSKKLKKAAEVNLENFKQYIEHN